MKYVLLFVVLAFCNTNASAQYYKTHQPDTLRWFIGKWVDNKTFKIDSTTNGKGGGGGTITKNSNGTLDISTPEKKDFEKAMNDGIAAIDADEKDISSTIKEEEGMYQFNLADKSIKELEKLKTEIQGLTANTDNTPPPPPAPSYGEQVAATVAKRCAALAPEYHRIIDFYKAHKKDKNPHFDLPAPPVADYFNCWSCDTAKQIEYDALCEGYETDFLKDIRKNISWLLAQTQQMEAMGIANGDPSSHDEISDAIRDLFNPNPKHPGACSYISYSDMCGALEFYLKRGRQMLEQLWKDNRKNYGAIKPVMQLCLANYQQEAAIGGFGEAEYWAHMGSMADPLEDLYDTMTTLLCEKKDYKLIGDIPFMIGLIRNIQSFASGSSGKDGEIIFGNHHNYKPKHGSKELLGFPHFELTVELDTKVGEKGSYTIAHLKSKSKVIAELDDKECVKFTLAKKEEDKIKADIITNEAISPAPHGIYVGTKTYTSQSPIFKIRFCSVEGVPTGDSIYLSTFVPLAPDKGNWNVQGKMSPSGINQADRLFINIDELKNDAQNIKPEVDQNQLEDIKKNSLEMADKIKAMQTAGNLDPMKVAEMVKQMTNNSGAVVQTQTSELMRIRLPLKVTNMDKTLINQRFDAKAINPQISQPIVYAYLTIKLEHTPTNGEDD